MPYMITADREITGRFPENSTPAVWWVNGVAYLGDSTYPDDPRNAGLRDPDDIERMTSAHAGTLAYLRRATSYTVQEVEDIDRDWAADVARLRDPKRWLLTEPSTEAVDDAVALAEGDPAHPGHRS